MAEAASGDLRRIPFSATDEATIASGGTWMRFMGVVQLVGGILGLVALVGGLGILGMLFAAGGLSQQIEEGVQASGQTLPLSLDAIYATMAVSAVVLLGMVVAAIWGGAVLYKAGDMFGRVARTDEADQAYLAQAFRALKVFFIIEAAFAILTLINAFSLMASPTMGMGGGS